MHAQGSLLHTLLLCCLLAHGWQPFWRCEAISSWLSVPLRPCVMVNMPGSFLLVSVCPPRRVSVQVLCPFFNGIFVFLLLSCTHSFCILEIILIIRFCICVSLVLSWKCVSCYFFRKVLGSCHGEQDLPELCRGPCQAPPVGSLLTSSTCRQCAR